jgi:hypothetical protein
MIRALIAALAMSAVVAVSHPAAQQPASPAAPAQPRKVNADALSSLVFVKRVDEYVALHRKLEATLPARPEHPTSAQLDRHAEALARLIGEARSHAKQGDVLQQDTRAYLRRQIGRALAGPDGPEMRRSIMEENPGRVQLHVNGRYPEGVPLTTMPPSVLAALPRLPEDVEYRFIGERLILLDVHAQVVVDYMDAAIQQ